MTVARQSSEKDEKDFSTEQPFNRQNKWLLAESGEDANSEEGIVRRSFHTASLMVLVGVCATGRAPLIFVEKEPKSAPTPTLPLAFVPNEVICNYIRFAC